MDQPKSREEIKQLHALLCKGLADPVRIAILYELSSGTKNVSEIIAALGLSQSTVSRHLGILRQRSLVYAERQGTMIYYSLADVRIIEALNTLREILAAHLQEQRQLAHLLEEKGAIDTDDSGANQRGCC